MNTLPFAKDELIEAMAAQIGDGSVTRELRLPQSEAGLIARIHRQTKVLEAEYLGDEVRIVAVLPARLAADLAGWFSGEHSEKHARLAESFETK